MTDIPGNTTSKAVLDTQDANLGTFSGQFETVGDHDFIKVFLNNGQTYDFYVAGLATGSLTVADATITVRDANGFAKVGPNADLVFTADATGFFFLDVSETTGTQTGEYSLISTSDEGNTNVAQTNGDDNATSNVNGERMLGRLGADVLTLNATGSDAFGQQGNDILKGNGGGNILDGGLGNDTLIGNAGSDLLFGDAGSDDLFGGSDPDIMHGGAGNDNLNGDAGNDFLFGDGGKDFLTGGANADHFVFNATSDSKRGSNHDVITDFLDGTDKIELGAIDAKKHGGANDAFKFIGTQAFHHKEGELRFVKIDLAGTASDKTIVQGDVNGDGKADIEIQLTGLHTLHATDFNL